jgi:undecaprenyl diphosphate synthase
MDGNNRWAKKKRLPGPAGHSAGVEAVRKVLRACEGYGVEVLTLFAFSSENWERPSAEVNALMQLLSRYLRTEIEELCADGVRLRFIGERGRFTEKLKMQMVEAESRTAANTRTTLAIAVDYGGQWDIANAAKQLAKRVAAGQLEADDISVELLDMETALADLPKPDLCIRTGGDARISNFMLWQFAYSELYFTETLWPDFGELDLARALQDFSRRERRFGRREASSTDPIANSHA